LSKLHVKTAYFSVENGIFSGSSSAAEGGEIGFNQAKPSTTFLQPTNLFVRKFTLTQVLNVPALLLLIELEDLKGNA